MFSKLFLLIALSVVLQQHAAETASPKTPEKKKVVCYLGTWATYRQSNGKYDVENIDPFLCTHVVYAFFGIQEDGNIRITDPWLDLEDDGGLGNIRRFNALKEKNRDLVTLAAVGGWNEGSEKFSIVANDPERRQRFANSSVELLKKYGFNGMDIDWEYPQKRHTLPNDDKTNFVLLLKELKEAFSPYNFILTAAVSAVEDSVVISYNVPGISKYLDIINVMAYDLHGPWDPITGLNAPLLGGPKDITASEKQLNVKAIVEYWLSQGAPRDKLVLGVPFYGHTYTLANASDHGVGSPSSGPGIAGQYSLEAGSIGYMELCERMLSEQWTVVWDDVQKVPYAYINQTWVSYDNVESISLKAEYAKEKDLGGVMVWSLEYDDFRGICGEKYPLLNTVNRVLAPKPNKSLLDSTKNILLKVQNFVGGVFSRL